MLWDRCQRLLEEVAGRLDDPPQRRYVTDGLPAWDCEQLTVNAQMVMTGTPQTGRTTGQVAGGGTGHPAEPATVQAVVGRIWKIPVPDDRGNPPTTEQLVASGREVVDGGWELWQAVRQALRELECGGAVDQAEAVGPEGGFAGWTVRVRWTP